VSLRPNVTLAQVVKAQVALLFGKYRPAGGLDAEEQKAVQAERHDFADRLVSMVQAIDAPEAAVIEQVRKVTRDVYADERRQNLPTVESLCSLVKRSFVSREKPPCLGCRDMGGHYRTASPDEPLSKVQSGEVPYEGHGHLCPVHNRAVGWYEHRECRRRSIPVSATGEPPRFEYPPPYELLPRGACPTRPPADDPMWTSWTDGSRMGPLAKWARSFVDRVYGHRVGETEESDGPLLENAPAPAEESEEWRNL
jgi:hypothetical protein